MIGTFDERALLALLEHAEAGLLVGLLDAEEDQRGRVRVASTNARSASGSVITTTL